MAMTKRTVFLVLLLLLIAMVPFGGSHRTIHAQSIQNQCNDGRDNDGDTGVDTFGLPTQGIGRDPQCTGSVPCENGSTNYPTCPDLLPTVPSGSGSAAQPGGNPGNTVTQPGGSETSVSSFPLSVRLKNPLGVSTIKDAIRVFMNAIIKVAIPFIVVFFIWSGLNFITARGNEKKLADAKRMFWYTVIGALLILGAWAITDAIVGTVNSLAN